MNKYKVKSRNNIISGILPRINAENSFYEHRLVNLCMEEGVVFVNLWDNSYNQSILFKGDGLQLNSVGSALLG